MISIADSVFYQFTILTSCKFICLDANSVESQQFDINVTFCCQKVSVIKVPDKTYKKLKNKSVFKVVQLHYLTLR